ncbi:T9SS type A sorting domain-containing protein [Labilibacter sediminis]|nr:T9SS type A sorting domain-containing protein [Labilibacter sediminis]
MKSKSTYLTILLFFIGLIVMHSQTFYKGADASYVNEIESCAGQVYKENGQLKDFYSILADNNANIVRFRLWHTPENEWSGYLDVKNAISRAKAKGLSVLLDFHYSDTWADPENQCTPAAWTHLSNDYPALATELYNYTHSVLSDLKQSGLSPEFVQVGNETNGGMCYNNCTVEWPNTWEKQTLLYNAGISACRDVDPDIKIILHQADPQHTEWWVSELFAYDVIDFDIVGVSFYPCYHGDDIETFQNTITNIKSDYNKDVMVVETSAPWTDGWNDDQNNVSNCVPQRYRSMGRKPTPEICSQWCIDLANAIYESGGLGLIYWGGEWIASGIEGCPSYGTSGGSTWENQALFDFENNLLPTGGINFMQLHYGPTNTDGPDNFSLISPAGSVATYSITYDWNDAGNADYYTLLVAEDPNFSSLIVNQSNITQSNYTIDNVSPNTTYYWKVIASNSLGDTESDILSFTTRKRLKSGQLELVEIEEPICNIYPNPIKDGICKVQFESEIVGSVRISNSAGLMLIHKEINNQDFVSIDCSDLQKGLYLIQIISSNINITETVVID